MKQKQERSLKRNTANFFGSFGYLFSCLQWFWVVMLYFSVIQSMTLLVTPSKEEQMEQASGFTFTLPDSSEVIILAIVTGIMIVITIYVLLKIPMGIAKTGNKIVHKTAETMTPIVIKAQHKKDTKKFRAKITAELILALKSLLIIIPVVLTVVSGLLEKQSVDYSIAMIIGGGLACFGLASFALQYILAGVFRIKTSDLW